MTYVYYYGQLSDDLKRIYLIILDALRTRKEQCALPFVSMEEVEMVLDCIVLEQPLICPFREYQMRTFNDLVFSLEFEYLLDEKTHRTTTAKLRSQTKKIADYARAVGSLPPTQIDAVHRFFTQRVKYDTAQGRLAFHTAGALLLGNAVCQGIGLGFKCVMDELCIPCVCVRGEHEGEPHCWNLVYCRQWHPFDLTVDVCLSNDGFISYEGFGNLPSPEKYRAWEDFSLPKHA